MHLITAKQTHLFKNYKLFRPAKFIVLDIYAKPLSKRNIYTKVRQKNGQSNCAVKRDCFGQFFEGVRHETMCNFSTSEIEPICSMLEFKKAIQKDIGFFENQVKKKTIGTKSVEEGFN
ncbi:hypothetical protein T07_981 [Trichinella nelsoni]|uniref:Uncharacterized protein n=1 Tax=Trichinella nelsoni TaxID=6336 RepID=A0A0V0SIT0_9BILA|nr:hypothetical protein T07_981 [Trichinella nelsoni]